MLLPHALVPISEVWTKDRPEADAGGSWVAKRENVERLLVTIIRRARRPMRHAKKIRAAARLTYAKFIALTYEWQTRRRPSSRKNPTGHVPGWKKILNTLAVTYGERIETAIK
jgi:hypothetical protein